MALRMLAAELAGNLPEPAAPSREVASATFVFCVSGNRERARRAAAEVAQSWAAADAAVRVVSAPTAAAWPFLQPSVAPLPEGPVVVWVPDIHEAFVNHQPAGTHLVTTQAGYLAAEWSVALREHGRARLLATADLAALEDYAPDLLSRRGPFRDAVVRVDETTPTPTGAQAAAAGSVSGGSDVMRLIRAFRQADAAERLHHCVAALADNGRTAPVLVATASACMEVNDLTAAARDLDEAVSLAPGWAAAHFERGKLRLRTDDMAGAMEAFRTAAEILPGFGPAWANLGATLGELDRTDEALVAFERALTCDPSSHQTINNIGVLRRELGRLAESEAAFREVVRLAPDLAVGYYNLGHTLFLQGRFHAALSAYSQGQSRDKDRNPVQATRLAACRLATGDAAGSLADLRRATDHLPREYRRQLLADTSAIIWALVTQQPDVAGWEPVQAWVSQEVERLR